jgi:sugar lactone lactonase YvrE
MTGRVETLLEGFSVPEGPRWHDGRLWFSDLYANCVWAADPSGKVDMVTEVSGHPSGLGWTTENRL